MCVHSTLQKTHNKNNNNKATSQSHPSNPTLVNEQGLKTEWFSMSWQEPPVAFFFFRASLAHTAERRYSMFHP